ncbi:MAG: 30S ribosomal protein S16 [Bacteroidetes bacterium]|jgi:small subunit ribosomal protein S16|nr:30S ribosomal protein S16 [Bacteroidota bacterium]
MVKIRLRRKGRAKAPFYDIVAMDARSRRDGAYLERIGYYNPMVRPAEININADRAIYWLNIGAQPTDITRSLMCVEGVMLARALKFKGKTDEEIAEAVAAHKVNAQKRYERNARKRIEKKKAKAAAAAAEKK